METGRLHITEGETLPLNQRNLGIYHIFEVIKKWSRQNFDHYTEEEPKDNYQADRNSLNLHKKVLAVSGTQNGVTLQKVETETGLFVEVIQQGQIIGMHRLAEY